MFTKFRPNDFRWLSEYFPQSPGTSAYANSWLYITQACRGALDSLGAYYRDDHFFVGLGLHNRHWVLVNPTGEIPSGFVKELADFVSGTPMSPRVYVKKASQPLTQAITEQAELLDCQPINVSAYPWDDIARQDDDTFPEQIIRVSDIGRVTEGSGHTACALRSKLRQYRKYEHRVQMRRVDEVGVAAVLKMLAEHFGSNANDADAYVNMLNILSTTEPTRWNHFVVQVHDTVKGFFAYEFVDQRSVGVYASIASRHLPGLSEAMLLHLSRELDDKGIEFANLGGSETATLHNFKRKFSPMREIAHPMLILDLTGAIKYRV